MREDLGTVDELWRYPVKSMLGERVRSSTIDGHGMLGDRCYAVQDLERGGVASAKNPTKWRALALCHARYAWEPRNGEPLPPVRITLPDGGEWRSDDRDVHDVLSRFLLRPVRLVERNVQALSIRETDRTEIDGASNERLVRDEPLSLAAPANSYFDVAPLHLLTDVTLASLGARSPGTAFDSRRFRPNVVLRVRGAASHGEFPENTWIGAQLVIGGALPLQLIDPTPRCVVTTLACAELPADTQVLRTIATASFATSRTLAPGVRFPAVAGAYATTSASGPIAEGDEVERL